MCDPSVRRLKRAVAEGLIVRTDRVSTKSFDDRLQSESWHDNLKFGL